MVAVAPKETRAALRIDIANFAPKVWPHALAFRIWRNTSMDSRDWQVRLVHIRCHVFLFEIIPGLTWLPACSPCARPRGAALAMLVPRMLVLEAGATTTMSASIPSTTVRSS